METKTASDRYSRATFYETINNTCPAPDGYFRLHTLDACYTNTGYMTYEERVCEVTKEFSLLAYGSTQDQFMELCRPLAIRCIQKQAEAFKLGASWQDYESYCPDGINEGLRDYGYIPEPPKTKTT